MSIIIRFRLSDQSIPFSVVDVGVAAVTVEDESAVSVNNIVIDRDRSITVEVLSWRVEKRPEHDSLKRGFTSSLSHD